jgi:hypothetical protein
LVALKAGLRTLGKIRFESLAPVRICTQVSFDELLACHFLRPNYPRPLSICY